MSTNVAPFVTQPRLTQIAMAIKPEGMIADEVLPRVPVEAEKFIYTKFTTEEMFTIPDTKVGRTSEPNQVEFGAVDVTDSTEDHGLDDVVPNKDIKSAQDSNANFDPREQAAENVAVLVALAREQRVANLMFGLNTYAASLRTTLSGTSQWSDYANSDPIGALMAAIDSMLVRPTDITFGQLAWTKFRQHPKVVAAILNKAGDNGGVSATGIATRQGVLDLLELRNLHVGQSFGNVSKKGQAASYARLWGKHCALLYVSADLANADQPCFGFTAQFGTRIAGVMDEPRKGLRGGQILRVGESVKEVISAPHSRYFFQNAVA